MTWLDLWFLMEYLLGWWFRLRERYVRWSRLRVNNLAWAPSPAHPSLAVARSDGWIDTWWTTSSQPRRSYRHATIWNPRRRVNALAWSPDGKLLASGGSDATVQIWEATSGRRLCVYRRHSQALLAIQWSPDGKLLASGGSDATVQIWEATSGRRLCVYRKHCAPVTALSWSPDGHFIASGSLDTTVRVWEAETGRECSLYTNHRGPLTGLSWSPGASSQADTIATSSSDGTVQIWEAKTGKEQFVYRGHRGASVIALAWVAHPAPVHSSSAAASEWIFSLDATGELHQWLTPQGKVVVTRPHPLFAGRDQQTPVLRCLAVRPVPLEIALGGDDLLVITAPRILQR